MFKRERSSCDTSQWNPFTKNFSAYLHVSLSLFSILLSLPLISSVSVLSAHLCICGPSYLSSVWCSASVYLLVADRLCSSDCPLVDPLCQSLIPSSSRIPLVYICSGKHSYFWIFSHPRLGIKILADNQSPGDPKRCDKFFSSHWSTFIWHLHFILAGLN